MKYFKFLAIVLFSGLISSCVTNKKITYLQYKDHANDTSIAVQPEDYRIQPFDNLYIRVVTPDPQWSDMFNTLKTSAASTSFTEQTADLISYAVDSEGNIELPYAGKLFVSGKSLKLIKTDLEQVLKGYVTDPDVTVKMINNYVSVLGEVAHPGRYPLYKDRMNVFQALAMAGDLGDFSDRQKVQIIRQIKGGSLTREFSLTGREILSSEFFYVLPNDVIYAKPMAGRFFRMNSFPYGYLLSAITTFILYLSVINK